MRITPIVARSSPRILSSVIRSFSKGAARITAKIGVRFNNNRASLAVVIARPIYCSI